MSAEDNDDELVDLDDLSASLADTGSEDVEGAVKQIAVAEGFDQ